MKPDKPIVYNEFYLDAMTGGSPELPAPVTTEQHYLAHLAGMTVTLPQPIILRDMFLAKICGMDVSVPTYIPGKFPRKFAYYAKAAGQDVEVPQPITREEMYWFDYVGGQPTPSEHEYTGAVPVTFTADGTPLLDYLISGNTVQNGTPTPDNPIMPEATGDKTGNLFDKDNATVKSLYIDSSIGTFRASPNTRTVIMLCEPNTTYTISKMLSARFSVAYSAQIPVSGDVANGAIDNHTGTNITITTDNNARYLSMFIYNLAYDTATFEDIENSIMVNSGSTALPYEPYGYKLDISSANATTPIYLGEVETTRKVKKLVLTGEEDWNNDYGVTMVGSLLNGMPFIPMISALSDRYVYNPIQSGISAGLADGEFALQKSGVETYSYNYNLAIKDDQRTSVEEIKSYLAAQYANGTPVTVWYVLATPVTGIVNEPLMRIGNYADTLSMEQAGVEIPTVNGSNTLDVLTTVKPSEVYIKYKGEPVAGSQTSSQSSAYAPAEVSSQSESIDDINSNLLGKEEETE